jgi:hypothetical protein
MKSTKFIIYAVLAFNISACKKNNLDIEIPKEEAK